MAGRYDKIRRDFFKGTIGAKYDPNHGVWNGKDFVRYKTEQGFRTAMQKRYNNVMKYIDGIENTSYPSGIYARVYYSTHGYQAYAKVECEYILNGVQYSDTYKAGPTHGGGYDKMSTAFADAMNQCPQVMKLLFEARVKNKKMPYGVTMNNGKANLPHLDGGVGMSSLTSVMKALGYKCENYTNKSDDETYIFRPIRKRN